MLWEESKNGKEGFFQEVSEKLHVILMQDNNV
jgi:hypothetical protein